MTPEGDGSARSGLWRDNLLLLVVALAVRILHWLAIRSEPLFDFPQIDAKVFWETALRLAQGAGPEGVFYKPPLFGELLALCVRVFGEDPGAARLVLLALSALAAPLTARLARPLLGRWWALAAGGVVALYGPAVFYGAELLPATLALLLNLAMLLCLVRGEASVAEPSGWLEGRSRFGRVAQGGRSHHSAYFWFLVAGLALGLSALTRPTILLFLPLLLIRYRHRPLRAGALLLLAATAVAIAPATIHNARQGDAVLVSSNGGVNFYMGNHATADGRSARAPELAAEPRAAERVARVIAEGEAGHSLQPSQVSRYWTRRALGAIAEDPGRALGLEARKLYYAFNNQDITDNIDFVAIEEVSPVLGLLPLRFGILFVFALPGILALRRRREGRLLLLYGATILASLLLFFVVGRFRLPLLPLMAIAGVAGVREVLAALTGRPGVTAGVAGADKVLPARTRKRQATAVPQATPDRRGRLGQGDGAPAAADRHRGLGRSAGTLFLALAGGLITFSSLWGVGEDRSWHYHYLCGDAFYRRGDTSQAILAYEESLARNAGVAATQNALAYAYAEAEIQLERAAVLARSALKLSPARRRHYLETLGWVLYKQGELETAAAAFEEAIELFPPGEERFRIEALEHLALVREAQGREGEAEWLRSEARRIRTGIERD